MLRWAPVLLLAACGERAVRIDVPREAHRSMIVAVEDDEVLEVHAIDLERDGVTETLLPSYIGSYEVRLTAFLYDRPLADLALTEGVLQPATEEPSRGIPSATSTMTLAIHGAVVGEWTEAEPDARVTAFRIAGVSVSACVDQGGCFDADSWFCRVPCPAVAEPDAPESPAPPACATGWSAIDVGGATACAPWSGATPECAGSEVIFPGEAACHALGAACPNGDWPEAPAGAHLYVRAGGTGDGSSTASPLGSIAAAIAAASGGEIVVIAAGTYAGSVVMNKAVTLFGACPERTRIDGGSAPAIQVDATDAAIENLTISGNGVGVEVVEGTTVRIADVIIEGTSGRAIDVPNPARAELRGVAIRNVGNVAMFVEGDGFARPRATLVASRVHIEAARGGLASRHADLTIDDLIVRRSLAGSARDLGRGMMLGAGVNATVRRTAIDDNFDIGVFIADATVHLEQVMIRGTKSHPADERFGHSLEVQRSSQVTVSDSWIDGGRARNVYLLDAASTTTFERSVLSNVQRNGEGGGGWNLLLFNGANGIVRDVQIVGSILAGIQIEGGSHLTTERARITDTAGVALRMLGGTASLGDLAISTAGTGDCYPCSGICVRDGARAEGGMRISIEGARGGGILANAVDSRITASQLAISDTRATPPCVVEEPPVLIGRGIALFALEGGQVAADHFLLQGSVESGAQIADLSIGAPGTSLDLDTGIIRDNAIGATVSLQDFDARRVATRTVYSNNETNLSGAE